MALKKFCAKSRCNNLCDMGQKYCTEHQGTEAERQKEYDQAIRYTKDKAYHDFYNSKAWKRVRKQAIESDKGLCQVCMNQDIIPLFAAVHQNLPIQSHWALMLTLSNLICLCDRHHQQAERDLRKRNTRRG